MKKMTKKPGGAAVKKSLKKATKKSAKKLKPSFDVSGSGPQIHVPPAAAASVLSAIGDDYTGDYGTSDIATGRYSTGEKVCLALAIGFGLIIGYSLFI